MAKAKKTTKKTTTKVTVEKEFNPCNFVELRGGISLEEQAEKMNVKTSQLEGIENFDSNPKSGPIFNALVNFYKIDPVNLKCFFKERKSVMEKDWEVYDSNLTSAREKLEAAQEEYNKAVLAEDAEQIKRLESWTYSGEGLKEAGFYEEVVEKVEDEPEAKVSEETKDDDGMFEE